MKVRFKLTAIIRNCKDDFGLGEGVLGSQVIEFSLAKEPDNLSNYDKHLLSESLYEHSDKMLKELVEVKIEQVK